MVVTSCRRGINGGGVCTLVLCKAPLLNALAVDLPLRRHVTHRCLQNISHVKPQEEIGKKGTTKH